MSVELRVVQLRANSLDAMSMELRWAIADTNVDVLDYTFTVLRGESAEGPFEPITGGFKDRYIFVDKGIPVHHRWRQLHYLVRVENDVTGDAVDFGPVRQEVEPDLVAVEIRSHMTHLFQEFSARRCWVLPIRTFGARCSCVTPTGARRKSGCITCFDTGFVRGYHHPIESYVQIDPSPKVDQVSNIGRAAPTNTTGRVTYYPPLKPRDIIVESENRRWRVNKVVGTEHSRAVIHQELELHEIPPSDVEFSIPINPGSSVIEVRATPARNYTNPQNLEAATGEVARTGAATGPSLLEGVPAPQVAAASVFSHRQEVASSNWLVNHNLGRYPVVVVSNLAGDVLDVAVTYVSPNQVRITPLIPFTGIA